MLHCLAARVSRRDRDLFQEACRSSIPAIRRELPRADDAMYLAKAIRGSGSVMSVGRGPIEVVELLAG